MVSGKHAPLSVPPAFPLASVSAIRRHLTATDDTGRHTTANTHRRRLPNPSSSLHTHTGHSHIQLLAQPAPEPVNSSQPHASAIPSFCSPSLQSSTSLGQSLAKPNPTSETTGTTFADMARRFLANGKEGIEGPTSAALPLSGYIAFKPARNRQGNKNWRPLELSSLDIDSSTGFGGGVNVDTASSPWEPAPVSDNLLSSTKQHPPLQNPGTHQTTFQQSNMGVNDSQSASMRERPDGQQPLSTGLDTENVHSADATSNTDPLEHYARLFGELPDLIHISERTGKFNGEVVFIGHPNRNVSAHQWFVDDFQWVAIGCWSYAQQRIEGSLAADRSSSGFAVNSIEQFKHLAKNRENRVVELDRSKREPPSRANIPVSSTPPSFGEDTHKFQSKTPIGTNPRQPTFGNVMGQYLEDPFVTPARPRMAAVPLSFSNRKGPNTGIGSINFGFEIPMEPTPTNLALLGQHNRIDSHQAGVQGDQQRQTMARRVNIEQQSDPSFREVQFGEEAGSSFSTPATYIKQIGSQVSLSPEDVRSRLQIKNKLAELGNQPRRFSIEKRVAIPDMPELNNNLQTLFPPGPTVANPYRGASTGSTLNAKAPPYVRQFTSAQVADAPESAPSAITAIHAPSNLTFSDPDGARQPPHEIVNGSSRQEPTPQSFNGPFFTESVPTTLDLTASLSLPVNHEEKLKDWFHDGQRPFRQAEYAKSLVAAAVSNDRRQNYGAIGEPFFTTQAKAQYENTSLFVRVYENLFEYAGAGKGSGPFTRVWKPAPQRLRDTTAEGNSSFFHDMGGFVEGGASVRAEHAISSRLAVPSQPSPWERTSRLGNSRAPAVVSNNALRSHSWDKSFASAW